jgi:hypothetical protein
MLSFLKKSIGKIPGVLWCRDELSKNVKLALEHGIKIFFLRHYLLLDALLRLKMKPSRYKLLSIPELKATRKSDRVFIFGSGYSLNDITAKEWEHFADHDTIGLSGFIYQRWVRTDYHLIRGWVETLDMLHGWKTFTREFAEQLEGNPNFDKTILIMQGDYSAQFCNQLLGYGFLRKGRRIFRYKTIRYNGPPTESLEDGLRHAVGTLCDTINFAYCMGWKEIVLVGVDLYDTRYFWLPPDKTLNYDSSLNTLVPSDANMRGIKYNQPHSTIGNSLIETLDEWSRLFREWSVSLKVYNPRSLLASVLDIYHYRIYN